MVASRAVKAHRRRAAERVPAGSMGAVDRALRAQAVAARHVAAPRDRVGHGHGEGRLASQSRPGPRSTFAIGANYVRGDYGTPKSRRSSRSVPLPHAAAVALERLYQSASWQDDDELVFGEPDTGEPLRDRRLARRYRRGGRLGQDRILSALAKPVPRGS